MTFERFAKIARTVRFMPGWEIRVTEVAGCLAHVHVRARVQNSGPPYHMITTNFARDFAYGTRRSKKSVTDSVKDVLLDAWDHEFAEWFRVNGRKPYDPDV